MNKVDQFESVFRAASKQLFKLAPTKIERVWLISDLATDEADAYAARVERFLGVGERQFALQHSYGEGTCAIGALLAELDEVAPDLICTFRGLHGDSWRYPYGLGPHVDVFSQAAPCPVLVLPHPNAEVDVPDRPPRTVMTMTDHLAGDDSLVNAALGFTTKGAELVLCHVEDGTTFDRYMEIISKLPSIDTETAREDIMARLLKEPADYIETCRAALEEAQLGCRVSSEVIAGHRLEECRRLVLEHGVELLALHARDHDQLAMHGMAHPLAVELSQLPILLV